MPRRRLFASVVVVLVLALAPASGYSLDITTCNQVVPANETGVLQNPFGAVGAPHQTA